MFHPGARDTDETKVLNFCSLTHMIDYLKKVTVGDWKTWEKGNRAAKNTDNTHDLIEQLHSQTV